MENQHRKIAGYRELSQVEIGLMNEIKAFEAQWNGLVDRLRANPALDQRSVSLAVTHGEDAFSRAVRAVAQPERHVAPAPGWTLCLDQHGHVAGIEARDKTGQVRARLGKPGEVF